MKVNKSLFEIFKKALNELRIGKTDFDSFKKKCSGTRYRNIPDQIKDDYETYVGMIKDTELYAETEIDKKEKKELEKRNTLLDYCLDCIIDNGYFPDNHEIKERTGLSYGKLFKSSSEFKKALVDRNPNVKEFLFNETDLDEDYKKSLFNELNKHRRFIITTAVSNKDVDEEFLKSLENLAETKDAMILLLPCEDVESRNKAFQIILDRRLKKHWVVTEDDLYLNKNVCLSKLKTSAKQINPTTGLARLVTTMDASIIVASTKQMLEYVPNQADKLPMALMTTGAVTVGDYHTDKYMSKRTSLFAENDHVIGAIIVEIEDDHIFHFRQLQASDCGSVVDLGVEFLPDGSTKKCTNNIFIMGDSHVGLHNEDLGKAVLGSLKDVGNVSEVVLHDIFNATSVTHHDIGKVTIKAAKACRGQSSLMKEAERLKSYLETISNNGYKLVIVKSNHDEHLDRYLEECRFVYDSENFFLACELCLAIRDGLDPLKYLMENVTKLSISNIKWLKCDEPYRKYGIELGVHGNRGSNGSKGNVRAFENGLGKCVIGHSHSARISRKVYQVGTMSEMDMGYNKGLSSWTRTCCLIYNNGCRQLINYIPVNGEYKWRLNLYSCKWRI